MALTAGDHRIECDSITHSETGDIFTHCRDNSGRFVPHDQWRNTSSAAAVPAMNIAAADATGFDLHQQIIGTDFGSRDVGQFQMIVFGKKQSFHVCNLSMMFSLKTGVDV
jgi:hypothetical protein